MNIFKRAKTYYKLGKFIVNNILKFPEFKFEDKENEIFFRKSIVKNAYSLENDYGCIDLHTIDYLQNNEWLEITMGVEPEERKDLPKKFKLTK